MRSLPVLLLLTVLPVSTGASPPPSAELKLPTINGKKVLASVNGDPVTLDEFVEQLGLLHQGVREPAAKARRQEPFDLLDRLINIKLVLQEARNIGLNEDPGVKRAMAVYRREAMGMVLLGRHSRAVTAPDPEEVRKIYTAEAREAKLTSYLVEKEEDALGLETRMKAGGSFDVLAMALVAAGKARAGEQGAWLRVSEMLPQIREAVTSTKPGAVSPRVRVPGGWAFFRLEELRVADDPAARKEAERQALEQKRSNAVNDYTLSLVRRCAKVEQKVLDGLDFETPKGFAPYQSDTRAVARVEGEEPVTVKELTEALQAKYYHGAERAVAKKKVNIRMKEVLDGLLAKRAIAKEAKRLRIDRTPEYATTVKEYEDGVLFGIFVERVIDPDIKLGDAELRAYVAAHPSEYTSPEMMRLDGLAFDKRARAEEALGNLRKGADFAWMRTNAAGQVSPGSGDGVIPFDPHPVLTSSLPADLRKALQGASPGEYRLYGDADGPYYVVLVREIVPPVAQPFEQVKGSVAKKAFEEKREEGVREWAKKLRGAYPVKTYVTRESLDEILGLTPAARKA